VRSTRPIIILGAVAVLAAGAAWAFATRRSAADSVRQDSTPPSEQEADGLRAQRTKGDPEAPITVFEISDFQCPYCRGFWEETLPQLEREYVQTGKVRFVFLNLPLVSLHPNAPAAHEFAMCAARQDRFWPVHDLLFQHQSAWANLPEPAPFFTSLSDSLALDKAAMTECLETGAVRTLIQQEAVALSQAGVTGTPSFVIEGGLMPNVPFELWRPVLDSIFAARTGGGS
jgi:protein-disulfide isomerase